LVVNISFVSFDTIGPFKLAHTQTGAPVLGSGYMSQYVHVGEVQYGSDPGPQPLILAGTPAKYLVSGVMAVALGIANIIIIARLALRAVAAFGTLALRYSLIVTSHGGTPDIGTQADAP
jgi:hypothetical protein